MARFVALLRGVNVGGSHADRHRYDVWFLKPPLTAAAVSTVVPAKEGVDQVWPGAGVIYASCLTSKATQSRLGRIAGAPAHRNLTIRNWNTPTQLLELFSGRSAGRM